MTVSCSAIQFSGSARTVGDVPGGDRTCSPGRSTRQGKPWGHFAGNRTTFGVRRSCFQPGLRPRGAGRLGFDRSPSERCPGGAQTGIRRAAVNAGEAEECTHRSLRSSALRVRTAEDSVMAHRGTGGADFGESRAARSEHGCHGLHRGAGGTGPVRSPSRVCEIRKRARWSMAPSCLPPGGRAEG